MSQKEKVKSAIPVVGTVIGILVILGFGFRYLAQSPAGRPKATAIQKTEIADRDALARKKSTAQIPAPKRTTSGLGAGMVPPEPPLFSGRNIHDVPLGEILDQAQRLTYDKSRGHEAILGQNVRGQTVRASIWPASGASSLEAGALRQGRIVARIESNHDFEELGLAGGLNYLWVEAGPRGGFRGVILPATAFAPLYDMERVFLTEQTPPGVPLEKGAYWVNARPWVGCGRC
jgi:hypothetical protein